MKRPTMQCSSKTLDYVKCSKWPEVALAITHALSLNHHRSIASAYHHLA